MNDYPNFVKKTLCSVVNAMELQKEKFVKTPGKDFTRHRIFDFSTIIKFVLSAGCSTLASELMNFFEFNLISSSFRPFLHLLSNVTRFYQMLFITF